MGLALTALAFALIGSSVFFSVFYLNIHREKSHVDSGEESFRGQLPPLTIAVPAYNEENVIAESLNKIQSLDYPDYSIKFVDDGSTDSTYEEAEKVANDRVDLIQHPENKGKAAALNTALDMTETDYFVVVDGDSMVDTELLENAARKIETDESLGAVISSVMPLSQNTLVRKLQVVEYRVRDFYRDLMAEVDILDVTPGAFSMYRTDDLRTVGGFDVGNLTEDLEIAWSLRKEGKSLGMVTDIRSRTELPADISGLYGQRVRWARGHIQNLFKHSDMLLNRRYGWFGLFQMPATSLFAVFSILGFGLFITGIMEGIYNTAVVYSSVGFRMPNLQIDLMRVLLGIDVKLYIPLAISLAVMAHILKKSYSTFEEDVQHPLALAVYFFGYFAIKPIFWISAIIKELFNFRNTWT